MFLRPCYRRKNGKRHAYWALCESYRTERGPRQRMVAYVGQLDEQGRLAPGLVVARRIGNIPPLGAFAFPGAKPYTSCFARLIAGTEVSQDWRCHALEGLVGVFE